MVSELIHQNIATSDSPHPVFFASDFQDELAQVDGIKILQEIIENSDYEVIDELDRYAPVGIHDGEENARELTVEQRRRAEWQTRVWVWMDTSEAIYTPTPTFNTTQYFCSIIDNQVYCKIC